MWYSALYLLLYQFSQVYKFVDTLSQQPAVVCYIVFCSHTTSHNSVIYPALGYILNGVGNFYTWKGQEMLPVKYYDLVMWLEYYIANWDIVCNQEGLLMEVRMGNVMRMSPFKLSKVVCGLIKSQIEFLLDRPVTCNNKFSINKRSPKVPIIKGGI